MTRYYAGPDGPVALRRVGYGSDNGIFYLLDDHLNSTGVILKQDGTVSAQQYYYPFGGNRDGAFSSITTKRFTGQYHEAGLPGGEGLSYYNARWYDAQLGRFVSADTLVPQPGNPQSFNRLAYVNNNPLRYTDPTGNYLFEDDPSVPYRPPNSGSSSKSGSSSSSSSSKTRSTRERTNGAFNNPFGEINSLKAWNRFKRAELKLLNQIQLPIPEETYSGYGGCSTRRNACSEHHPAVDTGRLDKNTSVYAAAPGFVVYIGWDWPGESNPNLGFIVIIEHKIGGYKFYSLYAHLDSESNFVSKGEAVNHSTRIGVAGDTGGNPGQVIHLHFEIRQATNVNLDPVNNPTSHEYYWAFSQAELGNRWVDLSRAPIFERHHEYNNWNY